MAHPSATLSEQRHRPVLTAFGPRPPLLCHHCPGYSSRHLYQPAIKGAPPPPRWSDPFSSSAFYHHCAAVLAIVEPPRTATPAPLQTPHQLPKLCTDVVSSLNPLAGALGWFSAPPPSLPTARFAPSWNPLLRLAPSSPSPPNQSHASPPTSSHCRRPPHHRPLPESSGVAGTVRHGARLPYSRPRAKRPKWARPPWPSRPNPTID
jgi:hypothetical protein